MTAFTLHAKMAPGLAATRSFARTMRSSSFPVLGAILTGKELGDFIRTDLGIPDDADEGGIEVALLASLATPFETRGKIQEALQDATICGVDLALARHVGFDPLRLFAMTHDTSVARIEDGPRSYRSIPRYKDRLIDRIEVAFTLARGVSWRNGTLTSRRAGLPQTLAAALPGRPLSQVVDHDWPGWRDVVITSASVETEGTLTVRTERAPRVALVAPSEGL